MRVSIVSKMSNKLHYVVFDRKVCTWFNHSLNINLISILPATRQPIYA